MSVRRLSKPPQLFAWIASGLTVALITVTQFLPQGKNPHLRGVGVCVLLVGGVFIFCPFYLLAKHGRHKDDHPYMQARVVVDRGLYAITRHPQYVGYAFLAFGFALLSQHWIALLITAGSVISFIVQAVQEESHCLAEFGEAYADYCRRVPRFNVVLGVIRLIRKAVLITG